MTRPILAALGVLLLAGNVSAQAPDRAANWMAIGYGALVGADVGISMEAIGRGAANEANPALAWAQDSPGWFGAAKVGLDTALVVGVYKWTKPRTKARYLALATLITVQAIVVGVNAHRLKGT